MLMSKYVEVVAVAIVATVTVADENHPAVDQLPSV